MSENFARPEKMPLSFQSPASKVIYHRQLIILEQCVNHDVGACVGGWVRAKQASMGVRVCVCVFVFIRLCNFL